MHDTVQVQNHLGNHPSRWDITGVIVEKRPFDQYVIKIHGSGRLTTRNRKFLKHITPYCAPSRPPPPIPVSSGPDPVIALAPPVQTTEVETQEHALPEARPDSGINTDADASQGYPTVFDDAETVTGQDCGLRRSAR